MESQFFNVFPWPIQTVINTPIKLNLQARIVKQTELNFHTKFFIQIFFSDLISLLSKNQ